MFRIPGIASAMPAPATPSITSPTPIGRQSNNSYAPNTLASAQVAIPQATGPLILTAPVAASDVTGTIPAAPAAGKLATVPVPATEALPDAIGGPVLRSAALKGDPTAAYEVGVRFAEGKGIAANLVD